MFVYISNSNPASRVSIPPGCCCSSCVRPTRSSVSTPPRFKGDLCACVIRLSSFVYSKRQNA